MGAFLLVHHNDDNNIGSRAKAAATTLAKQGFANFKLLKRKEYDLYIFDKIVAPICNHVEFPNGDFCAATGTLLFRGLMGKSALEKLYDEFDPNESYSLGLYGAFCLIIRKGAQTRLVIDRLGVYKAYVDTEHSIWSSSFLALCSALPRLDLDIQSLYEYVFQGATYGGQTLFAGINLADSDKIYHIDEKVDLKDRSGQLDAQVNDMPIESHVDQTLGELRKFYNDIAVCFGDNVDTALSGGYDSRLTLGLLLEQGVQPKVHVYGKSTDLDVVVAKSINSGERLGLVHIDKSTFPLPSVDEFPGVVEANFFGFDGCPADGIFNNGADLSTRRDRCKNRELMLNGGGGEVFRNFFYLRNNSFSVDQLLWTFYSRFDPTVCSERFSEKTYHSTLGRKIRSVLGTGTDCLTRTQIEAVYPLFRCRYWMGKNNSINNQFGSALTPFIDYTIVSNALTVPLVEKYFGKFEAQLICAVSRKLAAYNSAYGHNFIDEIPLSRKLSELLIYARPTRLRRYSYRLKSRTTEKRVSEVLSAQYRHSVLEDNFPFLNDFFRVSEVRDTDHYNRICTLEYLLQHYASQIRIDGENTASLEH